MRVALYARVSSDRQDVDLSIAAQLNQLREYAVRNGHVVVREFNSSIRRRVVARLTVLTFAR